MATGVNPGLNDLPPEWAEQWEQVADVVPQVLRGVAQQCEGPAQ